MVGAAGLDATCAPRLCAAPKREHSTQKRKTLGSSMQSLLYRARVPEITVRCVVRRGSHWFWAFEGTCRKITELVCRAEPRGATFVHNRGMHSILPLTMRPPPAPKPDVTNARGCVNGTLRSEVAGLLQHRKRNYQLISFVFWS